MGASRAVLLPRIKPRRRYFGGGSENEDPTACTTPHPDKKTRSRAPRPRAELTLAPSETSGNLTCTPVVSSGDAGRRPGRHDGTASEASETTSTSKSSSGFFPGNDGTLSRSKQSSRRERLERLRVETRAAGTRAVRAAVAADHEGRVEAAARDYAISLKHFDVYLRLEPDAALAEAVRSKAEQYRARLKRIREVLTRAYEPSEAAEPITNKTAEDDRLASRDDDDAEAERQKAKADSQKTPPTRTPSDADDKKSARLETFCSASPGAPRQPLRAIQHAAPGRFVVTLASAVVEGKDISKAHSSGGGLKKKRDATEPNPASNGDPMAFGSAEDTRLSSSFCEKKTVELDRALSRVTDEEADAWVEETPSTPSTRGASEGTGATKGAETPTLGDATEKEEAAPTNQKFSAEEKETRTTRASLTASREDEDDSGGVVLPALSAEEEHPPPPSTPPTRPAVSLRARPRRRAYWDAEFSNPLAFESPEGPDGLLDDDDLYEDSSPDVSESSPPASRSERVSDDVHRATNDFSNDFSSDFFFFESAVDDAVHKFNTWFDASLRSLGDSIEKTGSLYAPKVGSLFERGVSVFESEWRAQFPDDATYVSEMSKKEYPSEANAVMRAATVLRGDEKQKQKPLPKKGARAD
jgi:hypothetical protein